MGIAEQVAAKFAEYWEHIAVAIVGFVGGAAAHIQDVANKRAVFSWFALAAGAFTSAFLSPVIYLILRDGTNLQPELSFWLAGFVAFLGADKIKAIVQRFLESKIP